ncbi:hypothetical protein B0A55_11272 [Friedmanniomyces simplex]|uniref:Uncharacterized protein n=1 Tax=Friedmanniomyces simplex TaxID=329884 RepID=A0A4U0WY49_9PEZI|nr:hypothetical protein B0A55_11272 [Friedmanniomyces simplex]
MSRRVPNGTSDDGNGAGSGSPGLGWRGDPVRTTTQFDPSVPAAEATNYASPEIPDSASSREPSSSVEFQASNDDPSDNTAADLVEGISTEFQASALVASSDVSLTSWGAVGIQKRNELLDEVNEELRAIRLPDVSQRLPDVSQAILHWRTSRIDFKRIRERESGPPFAGQHTTPEQLDESEDACSEPTREAENVSSDLLQLK